MLLDYKPITSIFLAKSFRMHPDLCRFVSDAFYEGRLTNAALPAKHSVACCKPGAKGNLIEKACGVAYLPVEHQLNTQASEEEVETIAKLVSQLVGGCFIDSGGRRRELTLDDIVIVAPYNLQVRHLKRAMPDARIGTVDKFQGQEAPVAIVSLCASSGEECPRGLDFLLNRNRLNVAISRAKALAIVVGCPDLMATRCASLGQMELVNNLCWLAEHAGWSLTS